LHLKFLTIATHLIYGQDAPIMRSILYRRGRSRLRDCYTNSDAPVLGGSYAGRMLPLWRVLYQLDARVVGSILYRRDTPVMGSLILAQMLLSWGDLYNRGAPVMGSLYLVDCLE